MGCVRETPHLKTERESQHGMCNRNSGDKNKARKGYVRETPRIKTKASMECVRETP